MSRILIIGAGPAGLTAAYELLQSQAGDEVLVLEASDTVGGISRTVQYHGNRMDIGGHRFFSKDSSVMDWWTKMLPLQGALALDDKLLHRAVSLANGGPDPEKSDRVMLTRTRVSRIYYKGKFFAYPVALKWETFRNMGLWSTICAGCSYLASIFHKLPENSLENFYINRFGRVLYSMFFEGYTEKLWGRHPREISADWGAQRVKGLSIRAVLADMVKKVFVPKEKRATTETSLIETFYYPKFGPGQLWEYVASEVQRLGGEIRYDAHVTRVQNVDGRICGVSYVRGEETHDEQCDVLLSSMPLKDLLTGMQSVPENVQRIAAGLPYRDFVTVGLLVDRLKLTNKTNLKTLGGIVPDCWIYVQDTSVKLGRIQIFNNWSPYMVHDPVNTVWIGLEYFCTEGDEFWNMPEDACVELAIQELLKIGVLEDRSVVHDWHRERVQKAYPAYFDTYAEIDDLVQYLDTYTNLYCIGRNGQHRYNNMDHSMVTAFETVKNIRANRADKTNVWTVNTEKSYHEVKEA